MNRRREEGMALALVLCVLLMLSALGASLVTLTSSESLVAAHFRSGADASAAAGAALERAVHDLAATVDWTDVLCGTSRSAFMDGSPSGSRALPDGTTVDLAALVHQAGCGHDAACTLAELNDVTAERPWGANNPRWTLFASGWLADLIEWPTSPSFYLVVLVGDDGAENDGDPERDGAENGGVANPGRGIVEVRAEAFGPQGTRASVAATVAKLDLDASGPGGLSPVRVLAWHRRR